MASKKLLEMLNDQYNFELESAYVYLAMAADSTNKGLDGTAHWMQLQAQEEIEHAMKFYEFIADMDGDVSQKAIPEPKNEYDSLLEIMETALAHEKIVSAYIYELANRDLEEGCFDTLEFLNWFFMEQREEENTLKPYVQRLKAIGDNMIEVFRFDAELGQREDD